MLDGSESADDTTPVSDDTVAVVKESADETAEVAADATVSIADETVAVAELTVPVSRGFFVTDQQTGNTADDTVSVLDETVAVSDETVAVSDETVAVSDETVAVSDETVAVSDETVAVSGETVVAPAVARKTTQAGVLQSSAGVATASSEKNGGPARNEVSAEQQSEERGSDSDHELNSIDRSGTNKQDDVDDSDDFTTAMPRRGKLLATVTDELSFRGKHSAKDATLDELAVFSARDIPAVWSVRELVDLGGEKTAAGTAKLSTFPNIDEGLIPLQQLEGLPERKTAVPLRSLIIAGQIVVTVTAAVGIYWVLQELF